MIDQWARPAEFRSRCVGKISRIAELADRAAGFTRRRFERDSRKERERIAERRIRAANV
jgi:hypothetical protein